MARWIHRFAGVACMACAPVSPRSTPASAIPASAAPAAANASDVWWAPELGLSSLPAIPVRLRQSFADPYDTVASLNGNVDQKTVSNCNEYLQLLPLAYQPITVNDGTRYKLEGSKCQAIKALEAAKPAKQKSLAQFSLQDASVLSILPPLLGPTPSPLEASQRERATQEGKSWLMADAGVQLEAVSSSRAKVVGLGWTTEIEVLARADFNGDSSEDLLIQTLSYGTDGNWTEVKLRVLTQVTGKSVLGIALDIPV